MKERILRTLQAREILDIVHDQYINRLVEIQEIRDPVRLGCVLVLQLERVRTYVQHTCLRVIELDLIADGIGQVRLTYSAATIDKQRIEGRVTRLLCNRYTCRARQLV